MNDFLAQIKTGEVLSFLTLTGSIGGWAWLVARKITLLIEDVRHLKIEQAHLKNKMGVFQRDLSRFLASIEATDRAQAERLDNRLDKIERGLVAHIARSGDSIPDLDRD